MRTFPEARIDVITGEPGEDIFSAHPAVDNVYVQSKSKSLKKRFQNISFFRKNNYDCVVDLKNTFMPHLIGAKYKAGFSIFSFKSWKAKTSCISKRSHKKYEHLSKLLFLFQQKET